MKGQQLRDVDIAHPVAVGEHEGVAVEPPFQPQQTSAGQRVQARVDQVDRPLFRVDVLAADHAFGKVDRQIAAEIVAIKKVALDVVAHVAQGDVKIVAPVVGVMFHNVPENRLTANLDHRFGANGGLFLETRAHSAREKYNSHRVPSLGFLRFLQSPQLP